MLQRQLAHLRVRRLHVDGRCRLAAAWTEHIRSPALKLRLPRRNLIGVNVELLGKLRQCPIALNAASATLALKAGVWFRRGRLCMISPDSQATPCLRSGRDSTCRPVQISRASSQAAPTGPSMEAFPLNLKWKPQMRSAILPIVNFNGVSACRNAADSGLAQSAWHVRVCSAIR